MKQTGRIIASGQTWLISGSLMLGSLPIWVALLRDLGATAPSMVLLRVTGTAVLFLIALVLSGTKVRLPKASTLGFLFLYGFFGISLSFYTYILAVSLGTPVAEVIFLGSLSPVFAALFSSLFLKEELRTAHIVALVLSIIGSSLLVQIWSLDRVGSHLVGDSMALLNAVVWAVYFVITRWFGTRLTQQLAPLEIGFWGFLAAAVMLVFLFSLTDSLLPASGAGSLAFPLSPLTVAYGAGLLIFGTFLPQLALIFGLRQVPTAAASIINTLGTLDGLFLGWLILKEALTIWHLLGGGLILISVVTVSMSNRRSDRHGKTTAIVN